MDNKVKLKLKQPIRRIKIAKVTKIKPLNLDGIMTPRFKNPPEIEERTAEKAAQNLLVSRWVYKQTSSGRKYRLLIKLPAKLIKGHFTTDEFGNFIMLRDINPNYNHEADLDDHLDLYSHEIKIIKKEYLDQGFMDFTPKENGVPLEINDRLCPADMADKKLVKYLESVKAKHKKQQIQKRFQEIDQDEQNQYFGQKIQTQRAQEQSELSEQTKFVGYGFQVSLKYYNQALKEYLEKKFPYSGQKQIIVKLSWNERFEIMKSAQMNELKDKNNKQTVIRQHEDGNLTFGDQQNFSFGNI